MKKSTHVHIFGEDTRPARRIDDLTELCSFNTVLGTYHVYPGDVIEFPSNLEQMRVYIQAAPRFEDESMVHVLVLRNGVESYVSLGCLHYEGVCEEYACEFSRTLGRMPNDYERLKYLLGKVLIVEEGKKLLFVLMERYGANKLFFTPELDARPRGILTVNAPVILASNN